MNISILLKYDNEISYYDDDVEDFDHSFSSVQN